MGTFWEPWQSNLGNLIETFTMSPWEPGPRLLGNLYIIILGTLTTFTWKTWEPCREPWRNLEGLEGTFWEPWGTLGNLYLGTFTWEPLLGNLYLGTFTCEPLLGNLYLGTLGEWVLELLRSAPKPLLWLKTPKLLLLGKKIETNHRSIAPARALHMHLSYDQHQAARCPRRPPCRPAWWALCPLLPPPPKAARCSSEQILL